MSARNPKDAHEWLPPVRKLIPEIYVQRFGDVFKELVQEVEYEVHSKQFNFHVESKDIEGKELLNKPYGIGKSMYYQKYLITRKIMKDKLFLTHPIMRATLSSAILTIPELIINLTQYRTIAPVDISNLQKYLNRDLKNIEKILTQEWYPSISTIVYQWKIKNGTSCFSPQFVESIVSFISVQITELKRRSMKHVLDVMTDESQVPFIKMNLIYEGVIKVYPDPKEFYNVYRNLILKMDAIACNLTPLQIILNYKYENPNIPTQVSKIFCDQCCEKLEYISNKLYSPVLEYMDYAGQTYEELCDIHLIEKIRDYTSQERLFGEVLRKVSHFQKEKEKLRGSLKNIYFSFGRLDQSNFTEKLMNNVELVHIHLESHLINIHREEVKRIAKVFQDVENKTHTEIKCTEQVMEMTEFLNWAQSELLEQLREGTAESFKNLVSLMEITNINEDQMNLNSRIIEWLQNIHNIFEIQNSHILQNRQEREVVLAKKTENLNKSLEDLTPRLVVIELMDEIDNIEEYLPVIRKFLRKLEHFDKEVLWINKEEALFKFPLSTYPELDEHKNYILPFASLLNMIYKWQYTHAVWIESTFDFLPYEEIAMKTIEHKSAIEKKLLYYAVKFRQAEDNFKRYQGGMDEADLINLPTPMKLCVKALQQIIEFEEMLESVRCVWRGALSADCQRDVASLAALEGQEGSEGPPKPPGEATELCLEGPLRTKRYWQHLDPARRQRISLVLQVADIDEVHRIMQENTTPEWESAIFDGVIKTGCNASFID